MLKEIDCDWIQLDNSLKYGRIIVNQQILVNDNIRNKWQILPAHLFTDKPIMDY